MKLEKVVTESTMNNGRLNRDHETRHEDPGNRIQMFGCRCRRERRKTSKQHPVRIQKQTVEYGIPNGRSALKVNKQYSIDLTRKVWKIEVITSEEYLEMNAEVSFLIHNTPCVNTLVGISIRYDDRRDDEKEKKIFKNPYSR